MADLPKDQSAGAVSDQFAPPIDAIREHPLFTGARSVGMISGQAPRYGAQIPGEHEGLKAHLESLKLPYEETTGKYGGVPERSIIVHGPTREQLYHLGKKFGQESVLYSEGGKHEILYTNGPNDTRHHKSNGTHEFSPTEPADNYTFVPSHKGYLSLGFDWDQTHPTAHLLRGGNPATEPPMTKHEILHRLHKALDQIPQAGPNLTSQGDTAVSKPIVQLPDVCKAIATTINERVEEYKAQLLEMRKSELAKGSKLTKSAKQISFDSGPTNQPGGGAPPPPPVSGGPGSLGGPTGRNVAISKTGIPATKTPGFGMSEETSAFSHQSQKGQTMAMGEKSGPLKCKGCKLMKSACKCATMKKELDGNARKDMQSTTPSPDSVLPGDKASKKIDGADDNDPKTVKKSVRGVQSLRKSAIEKNIKPSFGSKEEGNKQIADLKAKGKMKDVKHPAPLDKAFTPETGGKQVPKAMGPNTARLPGGHLGAATGGGGGFGRPSKAHSFAANGPARTPSGLGYKQPKQSLPKAAAAPAPAAPLGKSGIPSVRDQKSQAAALPAARASVGGLMDNMLASKPAAKEGPNSAVTGVLGAMKPMMQAGVSNPVAAQTALAQAQPLTGANAIQSRPPLPAAARIAAAPPQKTMAEHMTAIAGLHQHLASLPKAPGTKGAVGALPGDPTQAFQAPPATAAAPGAAKPAMPAAQKQHETFGTKTAAAAPPSALPKK